MQFHPSKRLMQMSRRYAHDTTVPAGEAYQNAFNRYLRIHRESLLDVTVAAASVQIGQLDGVQDIDPLLLKAIRDTNPSLEESRLLALSGDELQGAVNTAKGKYFEYLVPQKLNAGEQVGPLLLEPGQAAVLAKSMNQPGWDLRIVGEDGNTVDYLQLKATDSVGYIKSALERYPDIQILATGDVAHSGLVLDSGITDVDLREHVGAAIDVVDNSLTESFWEHFHPLLPLAAMALHEGHRLAVGAQSIDDFTLALARRSQRTVATQTIGAAVYALDGGLMSIPAAILGGLVFDKTINQAALITSYESHRDKLLALRLLQQDRAISKEAL